ncbi:MAG: HEPN domain-containing protein [Lewinellaceae bacterium]|nr:HEPN domain-containing protein [Lewinellaceae bacterium]
MSKEEDIEYWKLSAEKDWIVVQNLFDKANYPHALFFAHLVLEKLLKAHFVKDNSSDYPPRTHNLIRLANQTKLIFSTNELLFIDKLTIIKWKGDSLIINF